MKMNFLTVCGSHMYMSLLMTVMISPFSHTIVYIVFSFSPFMLLGCTFLANFLLAHAESPSELPGTLGGWIKSSLRANTAVLGCPALKMCAPLLQGSVVSALGGMCIHKCTNPDKCKPSGHSISQYGDDIHSCRHNQSCYCF